jgi:hypothetical protein
VKICHGQPTPLKYAQVPPPPPITVFGSTPRQPVCGPTSLTPPITLMHSEQPSCAVPMHMGPQGAPPPAPSQVPAPHP